MSIDLEKVGRQKLKQYKQEHGYSYAAIAAKMEFSGSSFSDSNVGAVVRGERPFSVKMVKGAMSLGIPFFVNRGEEMCEAVKERNRKTYSESMTRFYLLNPTGSHHNRDEPVRPEGVRFAKLRAFIGPRPRFIWGVS